MSTSHTIRAHAQEVRVNQKKIKGGCQSGRKLVTLNCMSDLPLQIWCMIRSQDYLKYAEWDTL